jgi:hypothetical protein
MTEMIRITRMGSSPHMKKEINDHYVKAISHLVQKLLKVHQRPKCKTFSFETTEEPIENTLSISTENDFMNRTLIVQEVEERTDITLYIPLAALSC